MAVKSPQADMHKAFTPGKAHIIDTHIRRKA